MWNERRQLLDSDVDWSSLGAIECGQLRDRYRQLYEEEQDAVGELRAQAEAIIGCRQRTDACSGGRYPLQRLGYAAKYRTAIVNWTRRDPEKSIEDAMLKRLTRRARMQSPPAAIFDSMRYWLKVFVGYIVRDINTFKEFCKRRTITSSDVAY
eukprot:COSAG06_NODE_26420_length_615_cov_0.998062_1_plen_152_part_10